jgi:fluoroquinolone transport system permease protein
LRAYYPVITASLVAFGPSIYGFVVGMFVLEDREQGVLVAFRTSPLSGRGYLLYRGITVYVLSVVATLPALAVVGLVEIPPAVLVGGVVVGALSGPLVALGFGTLASNTIEGIALSKLVNLVVLGPAIVVAVVPEPLQFAAGVLPTYWPVKAVVAGILGESSWVAYLAVGALVQFVWLVGIGRWFVTRAD